MNHEKRIFALGFFDGVHRGHQALLAECVRMARAMDVETAAITFESHPQSLFRSDVPPLLTTLTRVLLPTTLPQMDPVKEAQGKYSFLFHKYSNGKIMN